MIEEQNLPRKSSRTSGVPTRFKDYVYDIPGKRETELTTDSTCATMEEIRKLGEFSENYLSYINNVLRIREPLHYT